MTAKKTREIILSAISHYGEGYQVRKAIEELVELLNELTRYDTGRENLEHIAEEMADVTIVMWELTEVFGNEDKVAEEIDYKLNRLQKRIKRDKKDNVRSNKNISFSHSRID